MRYYRGMAIDMKALARAGAEARLRELLAEIEGIRRAFPGIGGAGRGRSRATATPAATKPPARRGRRKPMTAAEKKAVSDRMKKYWAGRRKKKS